MRNTIRVAAIACLLCAASPLAEAQPVTGFYVQGGAGLSLPQTQTATVAPSGGAGSAAATANAAINPGAAESGSAGVGIGNGLRLEVEGLHTGALSDGGPSAAKVGGGDP